MTRTARRIARSMAVTAHLAVAFVLVALWLLPLRSVINRRLATLQRQRITRWWMRRLLGMLAVRVEITGGATRAPALIVANHVSWIDIPCLLTGLDTRFVAKTEVARWPLIGWLAAGVGTLFLARGAGAGVTADGMTFALVAGERVAIFPEGTSSDGRSVLPFHARLYQAAIRAAVPVQAVAIRYPLATGEANRVVPFVGDDNFIRHLWRLLGEREIVAHLHFCPPLAAGQGVRRVLADETRNQIEDVLASDPALRDRGKTGAAVRPSSVHTRRM